MKFIVGAVAGVVLAAAAGSAYYVITRDDGPNDATRLGCRIMADAVVRMDPNDASNPAGRQEVRALIGDAMAEFRDSNDDVIHDAASDVELSYTTLDDSLFRDSMGVIDDQCREHYALGWDE